MYRHAQLDEENICFCVSENPTRLEGNNIILLENGEDPLGMKYDNGVWEDVEQPEPTPQPLSETEQAILQTAINTEYMVAMMENTI